MSLRREGPRKESLANSPPPASPPPTPGSGSAFRPAEVELPGNCGAKGWLAAVKDVQSRRIHIDLRQRYPGADNVQHITASVTHGGTFTFFGPGGAAASLSAIVASLPLKPESFEPHRSVLAAIPYG